MGQDDLMRSGTFSIGDIIFCLEHVWIVSLDYYIILLFKYYLYLSCKFFKPFIWDGGNIQKRFLSSKRLFAIKVYKKGANEKKLSLDIGRGNVTIQIYFFIYA